METSAKRRVRTDKADPEKRQSAEEVDRATKATTNHVCGGEEKHLFPLLAITE